MQKPPPKNPSASPGVMTASHSCSRAAARWAPTRPASTRSSKTGYQPDWIAGVSIGAINAALIAGNPPERRIERLVGILAPGFLRHWPLIEAVSDPAMAWTAVSPGTGPRSAFNQFSALRSAMLGIPGFYRPRIPPAVLQPDGMPGALSVYDTAPLRATLERLIDFDLINSKKVRLSVGAVNVRSGNSEYFDNFDRVIGPEHIMASGALPPAFPPVTIDGEAYWDGGIVSNTPLQYVLDARAGRSLLAFQVDLFSARGEIAEQPRRACSSGRRTSSIPAARATTATWRRKSPARARTPRAPTSCT